LPSCESPPGTGEPECRFRHKQLRTTIAAAPLERAALKAAGKDIEHLTPDDLAPIDEFHNGQRNATIRLAQLAGVSRPWRSAAFWRARGGKWSAVQAALIGVGRRPFRRKRRPRSLWQRQPELKESKRESAWTRVFATLWARVDALVSSRFDLACNELLDHLTRLVGRAARRRPSGVAPTPQRRPGVLS
jgi:hypothetical protein